MKEKVKDILKSTLELDTVSDEISQYNCERWDSLNHLNVIVALEEEFDLSFEPEDITSMNSLDIICSKIERLMQ